MDFRYNFISVIMSSIKNCFITEKLQCKFAHLYQTSVEKNVLKKIESFDNSQGFPTFTCFPVLN